VVRAACQLAAARLSAARAQEELAHVRNGMRELNRIGLALMLERDADTLLRNILEQAKRLTESDGGALFLTEENDDGQAWLRFKLLICDSLPRLPAFEEKTWPIDASSIIGYAASTGELQVIEDAYNLPADAPFVLNREFDESVGYRRKSMLFVPMMDRQDQVLGVLVLANRKSAPEARIVSQEDADRYVLPYTEREVELGRSLAGQAAVSIENFRLYAQIERLFECFVQAAVTAIDQRDPTTAGHSTRVAILTTDLASALERSDKGPYRDVHFTRKQMRELRYAALLHDFGKVAVREEVLLKAKKLPPVLNERVQARFEFIQCSMEAEYRRMRADLIQAGAAAQALAGLEAEFNAHKEELRALRRIVHEANQPSVLAEPAPAELIAIARRTFQRADGQAVPYLSDEELHYLQIPCGSLDERERGEVESHAQQTFYFLSQIPWTDDLQNLPTYAYGHHEKLNGAGYPRRVSANEIPIQTRIITIADIFDALTEADRPYKRAVGIDQALDIMRAEAKAGLLDPDLVQVMIDSQVYRGVLDGNL
ncbi:MAG: GAF and HD-GYP domain-containing protein, partial [Longimicrobiales bacterium]